MSPFCRSCLGVAQAGELRCPLDQEFFCRRDCPSCGGEVYPREVYCAQCGAGLEGALETLLLPAEAARLSILGSLFLDSLGVFLLVGACLGSLVLSWTLPLGVSLALLYRALARAQGRQSFGQAVFHLATVDLQAKPAGYFTCLKRTLAEPPMLLLSLKPGSDGGRVLEEMTASHEVRLV